MSGVATRLLMLFVLLLGGLHMAAPADAGLPHHAENAHPVVDGKTGQVTNSESSDDQQDADLHGSHHNCPVASDQALAGGNDFASFPREILFTMPVARLASRALAPPLDPPLT
ncbi:MAG: hypothetical protein KYX64_12495 [Sphingopyxis sp.]|nr:hypothetical protein [Sphingopyxis sp.]